MNENTKRIWALANSILMIAVLISIAILPERFFVIGDKTGSIEIFVFLVIASTATFLLSLFISSFMMIQRSKECPGNLILSLIGSMLSLLFLMAVKILADELGREWASETGQVTQHGEFWIMYACLGLVLGFMAIVGLRKQLT